MPTWERLGMSQEEVAREKGIVLSHSENGSSYIALYKAARQKLAFPLTG